MYAPLLDFWVETFTEALKDNTSDALKMIVVQKAPFQEDPTRKAPYLILDWDSDKGTIPAHLASGHLQAYPEIGGPAPWIIFMKLRAAPRVVSSADLAYRLIGQLAQRCMFILRKNVAKTVDLLGSATVDTYDWLMIDKVLPHVTGGEREWITYVDIFFHVRISEAYPYGTYVSELEL